MSTDIPFAEALPPQVVTARALNAPVSAGDKLYVQIPSMGAADRWEANWTPHGTAYPVAGTDCLVALDEKGHAWVISWVGPWT